MRILSSLLILAVVQGLTEFLPVSSSGHLVLVKQWLPIKAEGALIEIILHAGTLISVVVYFRKRLWALACGLVQGTKEGWGYAGYVVLASCPAAVAYWLLGRHIEEFFGQARSVAGLMCVNGLILLSMIRKVKHEKRLAVLQALSMGLAQAVALLPGISRSGSTIVTGRHMGVSPEKAAEFSLIMSLPAVGGALMIKLLSLPNIECAGLTWPSVVLAIVVAAVVGYAAIACLIRMLAAGSIWLFGIYCLVVGGVAMAVL